MREKVGRTRKKLEKVKIFRANAEDWGIFCRRASGLLLLGRGSPPDPVFSRYTRYAATTRVNIDDF